MTIIKINAITVPADGGDELARRFAARAGAVDDRPGFEGFELLRPTDERLTWLVITRWADVESFQAWVSSPAFGHGHRGSAEPAGEPTEQAGTPSEQAAQPTEPAAQPTGPADPPPAPKPAMSSELWSYEIAGGSSR